LLAVGYCISQRNFTSSSIAASQSVEEQPLQQFTLPEDALSRLCFFSVPLKLNPFYR
jgi:hypothetical protein